ASGFSLESSKSLVSGAGAERRQVTVLFADLVGSTQLSTQLDPEDMRDVITHFQRCCTKSVTEFGGYLAKFMGDGALAYFGWPTRSGRYRSGVSCGTDMLQAALKPCDPPRWRPSSPVMRSSRFSFADGISSAVAKARPCSCPATQGSASRA